MNGEGGGGGGCDGAGMREPLATAAAARVGPELCWLRLRGTSEATVAVPPVRSPCAWGRRLAPVIFLFPPRWPPLPPSSWGFGQCSSARHVPRPQTAAAPPRGPPCRAVGTWAPRTSLPPPLGASCQGGGWFWLMERASRLGAHTSRSKRRGVRERCKRRREAQTETHRRVASRRGAARPIRRHARLLSSSRAPAAAAEAAGGAWPGRTQNKKPPRARPGGREPPPAHSGHASLAAIGGRAGAVRGSSCRHLGSPAGQSQHRCSVRTRGPVRGVPRRD